jgi:hypothetical protein
MSHKNSHAITFRLGDRQYDDLVRAVESVSAKSVSEFTRTAVMARVVSAPSERVLEHELDAIIAQLESLDAKLRQLRRQFRILTANWDSSGS